MIVDENASTESQPVLREQLSDALKEATEAQDQRALAIVRLIHTALKERDQMARAEGHPELTDRELMAMLQAMVEQRCESIRRYEESGQLELAGREAEEIEIIKRFLPAKLDDQACAQVVSRVIEEIGASKLKDTGRVMSELKSRYPNKMDFAQARRIICRQLG